MTAPWSLASVRRKEPCNGQARQQSRQERQRIHELDRSAAAREELTEKGYDGVTMEALAERAGVVKKTLYNLYGSKDDLLMAASAEITRNSTSLEVAVAVSRDSGVTWSQHPDPG